MPSMFFLITVFAVVSVLFYLVSWKIFAAFLIVMFWGLINAFLPSGLSNVWYNKRIEQMAAGRTVKYRNESELEYELGFISRFVELYSHNAYRRGSACIHFLLYVDW